MNRLKKLSVLSFTIFFLCFPSLLVAQQPNPMDVVHNYVNILKAFAETGEIKYRIQLDKVTPPNCLVNDIIAQQIAKEGNYPAGTLRIADYYNALKKWNTDGRLHLYIDHLDYQKNVLSPDGMSVMGDTVHVVMGQLNLTGPYKFSNRVMYFVRRDKITKIIGYGDGDTMAKGIELYSNKQYNEAFSLFRKMANNDRSNYMAQYWTALMLLKEEGCKHIHPAVRRQEAIWWLERGRKANKDFLKVSWEMHRSKEKDDISYTDYVLKYGDDLTYNHYPEAFRLMIQAFNDYDLSMSESVFTTRKGAVRNIGDYKPITHGLIMSIRDGKYGYVNEQNRIMIPHQYTWAYPFLNNGLAMVYKGEKEGFINTKGEELIPCRYEVLADAFVGHTTIAVDGNLLLFISDKNEIMRKISGYTYLHYIKLDKYFIIQNPVTKKGDMFDEMGNVVVRDIDYVRYTENELYKVFKEGKEIYSCYLNWN